MRLRVPVVVSFDDRGNVEYVMIDSDDVGEIRVRNLELKTKRRYEIFRSIVEFFGWAKNGCSVIEMNDVSDPTRLLAALTLSSVKAQDMRTDLHEDNGTRRKIGARGW